MTSLTTTTYEDIADKIRIKCQKEHWFGSELSKDLTHGEDPERHGFFFPPASEKQLQDAEDNLGFLLPPFLRYLYVHIANGGFGPGTGLHGIANGFGSYNNYNDPFDRSIVGCYRWMTRECSIDLAAYPPAHMPALRQNFWRLPLGTWPKYLIPLSDMGCARVACVDKDNQMFLDVAIEEDDMYGLVQLDWTLEEWITRWLNDEATTW